MKAYHFLKDDMCGGWGNEPPWKDGEERTVNGELIMCQWGYHASPSYLVALQYAMGNVACKVELSDEIQKDTDKYVARTRKLIKSVNVNYELREFACRCAERALKSAKVKDIRCWNAITVSSMYNDGFADINDLNAAGDAAGDAAWDAAGYAAGYAAWAAAWAAAGYAAGDAAGYAAGAAAGAAAWDAARAAAGYAARDAAWDAAWAAAWAAEIKWQKRTLARLINKAMKSKYDESTNKV